MAPKEPYRPSRGQLSLYPETAVGGYSHVDGAVEFYGRVNVLVDESSRVLDFGAGRGAWAIEPYPPHARHLRNLRGRVQEVVGTDVDPEVLTNPTLDAAHVVGIGEDLPFEDASFDLVMADYVLEHVDAEAVPHVAGEVMRVLKPGGWFAARTPNRWGSTGIAARTVPNEWHTRVLRVLQPGRVAEDVFPVRYAMNTRRALRSAFAGHEVIVYSHASEPAYVGNSPLAWRLALTAEKLMPRRLSPTLMVFVRKAGDGSR